MRVSAAGGAARSADRDRRRTKGDVHAGPSFLPDGRHFLYRRIANPAENGGLYVGSLDASRENRVPNRISTLPASVFVPSTEPARGRLLFLRQGTLAGAAVRCRNLEIVGEPVQVAEQVGQFAVSQNGALAYRTVGGGRDLQLTWFDRQGKVLSTVGKPARFQFLTLSPDAKRAAVN